MCEVYVKVDDVMIEGEVNLSIVMFCMASSIFVITKSRRLPCIQVDSEIPIVRFKSNNWLQRVIPEGDDKDRVFHDQVEVLNFHCREVTGM